MTEGAVAFRQDVKERSKQKNSAYHRKNGTAVSKLGQRRMTWKEINERHGECKTYDLNGMVGYSEFVDFPNDLKVEYVNKLMDQYDIELQHISRYLFNKGDDGLRSYLRNNKLLKLCDYQKPRAKTGLLQFQADIEEWKRRLVNLKAIDESEARRKREIIWNAEFITLEQFESLSHDGQIKYCNNLINKHEVSLTNISNVLFEKTRTYLRDYFYGLKLNDQIQKAPHRGSAATPYNSAFILAVNQWRGKEMAPELEEKLRKAAEKSAEAEAALIEEVPEPETEFETMDEAEIAEVAEEMRMEPIDIPAEEIMEEPVKISVPSEIEPKSEPVSQREALNTFLMDQATIAKPQDSMTFASTYVSENGLDEHQLYALISLFQNKKVRVVIDIQVL